MHAKQIVEGSQCCNMCGDALQDNEVFCPCDCAFRLCAVCMDHVQKYEDNRCPGCAADLRTKDQCKLLECSFSVRSFRDTHPKLGFEILMVLLFYVH